MAWLKNLLRGDDLALVVYLDVLVLREYLVELVLLQFLIAFNEIALLGAGFSLVDGTSGLGSLLASLASTRAGPFDILVSRA